MAVLFRALPVTTCFAVPNSLIQDVRDRVSSQTASGSLEPSLIPEKRAISGVFTLVFDQRG